MVYFGQWEPFVQAVNITPVFGAVAITFGIENINYGNELAGWVQICLGIAAIIFGVVIG